MLISRQQIAYEKKIELNETIGRIPDQFFVVTFWKNRRNPTNFGTFSIKKILIFYTKIRSFMVGTKIKIKKFEIFLKNRRNFTNFVNFSFFLKHHPVRPEPAAVLTRSNIIETFWKIIKIRKIFAIFREKKNGNFYSKNGSFMVGTKIKKCRKFWKFWSIWAI